MPELSVPEKPTTTARRSQSDAAADKPTHHRTRSVLSRAAAWQYASSASTRCASPLLASKPPRLRSAANLRATSVGDRAAAPSAALVDSSRNGSASSSLSRAAECGGRGANPVVSDSATRTHAQRPGIIAVQTKPRGAHPVLVCCRCVAGPAGHAGTLQLAEMSWPPPSHAALHPGCPRGCSGGRTWAGTDSRQPWPGRPCEETATLCQGTFSHFQVKSVVIQRAHGPAMRTLLTVWKPLASSGAGRRFSPRQVAATRR